MSNKYKEYYRTIEENQYYFKKILNKLNASNNMQEKWNLAYHALQYVTFAGTGYYYSKDLESFYVWCAGAIDIEDYNVEYKKNSFLHVMTEAYLTGGHTRVVERWIGQSDPEQKHSVVIINQVLPCPDLLEKNVKSRNGEFILLTEENVFAKAVELRKLGLQYEYIILHTHMHDPTATIAFGTEKFTRPIILFNHADHMFWLGRSIADIVADIRTIKTISKTRKNMDNTFMLGIPVENRSIEIKDKDKARSLLGIPQDKKIILLIGGESKFESICGDSIVPTLQKILDKQDDLICYIMGPSPEVEYWKRAYQTTEGKVIPLGPISYGTEYFDYIAAADLIIDSYPTSGGTALLDCIMSGKTVLSMKTVLGQLDYIEKSQSICSNKEELVEKAIKVLNDEKYAKELSTGLRKLFDEECAQKNWSKRLKELLEKTPKTHNVKDLTQEVEPLYIDDYDVVIDMTYKNHAPKKNILHMI